MRFGGVNRDFGEKLNMRRLARASFIAGNHVYALNGPAMTMPLALIRAAQIRLNFNIIAIERLQIFGTGLAELRRSKQNVGPNVPSACAFITAKVSKVSNVLK